MYINKIGGRGSGPRTRSNSHNICSIILGLLIAISIILFIIGIVMFAQPPKKIAPLGNPHLPAPITYSRNAVVCDNINLISVKSYADVSNRTVYTIKSSPSSPPYNNAISLASGHPLVGFYSCTKNNACQTYTFVTDQTPCTDYAISKHFTAKQNCIGGRGCHAYNIKRGTTEGPFIKYPIPPGTPS